MTTKDTGISSSTARLSRRQTLGWGAALTAAAIGLPPVHAQEPASDVFFSRSVTPQALLQIYDRLRAGLSGRIGIKIHGGEAAVNLSLFRALQEHIPGSVFIETNWASDFSGSRGSTQSHLAEIRRQGVDFAPVDVLDREGSYRKIPIRGWAELRDIEVPTALLDDLGGVVVLTNFKIPSFAGFTGAIKNIGIGLVSPDAKALVHGAGYQRIPGFFTRMADAAAGIKQYFGPRLICISLLTDMKASAFAGVEPQAGTLGIVGSLDPTAVDQAACDLLWHLTREQESTLSLQEKIDSGYLQLECMAAIASGSRNYRLTALEKV